MFCFVFLCACVPKITVFILCFSILVAEIYKKMNCDITAYLQLCRGYIQSTQENDFQRSDLMAETYNMSHSVEQSSFSRSDQGKAKAKGRHLQSFTVLNIDNQTVCPS